MKKSVLAVPLALFGLQFGAFAQSADMIPSGTQITVRTNESIDLKKPPSDGRIYGAVVNGDVRDRSGNVAIPKGSDAELIVRNVDNDQVALDIESVTVNGRRYLVSTTDQQVSGENEREGVGKNKRTAKYLGGGALLGTIVGAIAGGGKGAAIGAAAGAGAGAATQTITKGHSVEVPSESLLTFRLDRSLMLGRGASSRDNFYQRNGHHYHYDTGNADRQNIR